MAKIDLQKELTATTAKINQLKGRQAASLARLETEFGFSSVEEAEAALEQTEKEAEALETQYNEEYDAFITKWGDKLSS